MQKLTILIDGYNLYHAVDSFKKPHLKWSNPRLFCKFFVNHKFEEIIKIKFFTAFPKHKSIDVQQRYVAFTSALKHYEIEVIEGNFKKKIVSIHKDGKQYTRPTHEEKESDVNLALAIVEDSFEKTSDRILIITNDSDITPAIKMAREKNPNLKINILTPPLGKTKQVSHSLYQASGTVGKDRRQIFHHVKMIREFMFEQAMIPEEIMMENGEKILMPKEYRKT